MSYKITRREALKEMIATAAATATVAVMSPVVAAPQPLNRLPAASAFPGCILIRDHRERNRWQHVSRFVANKEENK